MTDTELGSRERDLLDAYREHHAMPAASRTRVWASLAGPGGGGGGSAIESASEPWVAAGGGAVAVSGWSRPSLVAAAGLLVAAGITLIVLGIGGPSGDRGESVAVVEPRVPASEPEPVIEPPSEPARVAAPRLVEVTMPEKTLEPIAEPPRPRARARKSAPEPIVTISSPSRERELIESAHAALAKGDTAAALAALDEHARDFAQGVFVEERQALDAIARCKSGDLEQGQVRARTFLDEHPRAVLATRVRRACELEGAPSE
jgi:hypothetical protein